MARHVGRLFLGFLSVPIARLPAQDEGAPPSPPQVVTKRLSDPYTIDLLPDTRHRPRRPAWP